MSDMSQYDQTSSDELVFNKGLISLCQASRSLLILTNNITKPAKVVTTKSCSRAARSAGLINISIRQQ